MKDYILLNDGRKLGYKEYGDSNGFPVIGLHGTPGSRIWFKTDDDISKKIGVRLITIDRPGYGLSTKKKNRKISDFNNDINQLLEELKIRKFSIFGVSGGGAYALSYAANQNKLLFKAGIVASIFPFRKGKIPKEMCKPNRIAFILARKLPWLLKYTYKKQKSLIDKYPQLFISSIKKNISHLCKTDQKIVLNDEITQTTLLHLKEAFNINSNEAVNELRLFYNDWNINFKTIRATVEVWHGEDDTLSPIDGIKYLVTKIPNVRTNYLESQGHFLDENEEIWSNILLSLKA